MDICGAVCALRCIYWRAEFVPRTYGLLWFGMASAVFGNIIRHNVGCWLQPEPDAHVDKSSRYYSAQTNHIAGRDLPFMQKAFRAVNIETRNMGVTAAGADDLSGRTIVVAYSTDKGANFIPMGTVTTDGRTNLPFTITAQTTLSDSATVNANSMRLRFTLTRGSVASKSPVLVRYSVDFLNRPLATHAHSLNLRLGTTMTLRNGTLETVSVLERLQFIKDIEDAESPIRFIDMTGRHYLVYVTKTSVVKVEKENVMTQRVNHVKIRLKAKVEQHLVKN